MGSSDRKVSTIEWSRKLISTSTNIFGLEIRYVYKMSFLGQFLMLFLYLYPLSSAARRPSQTSKKRTRTCDFVGLFLLL